MKYGITYQGSKNKIAEFILNKLPSGKRFVDLFGGGAAMSHAAALSGKYESIYYNELNPLLYQLIKDTINGKFNPATYKQQWVSREDFFRLKETDGQVKYLWSFACAGTSYAYSKEREPLKKAVHYARVFNDYSLFEQFYPVPQEVKENGQFTRFLKQNEQDIKAAYIPFYIKNFGGLTEAQRKKLYKMKDFSISQSLQSLESLASLASLESLESLARLPIVLNCGDYRDYKYQAGDIVYLDPPYEGTEKYDDKDFDHKEFYDWVYSRPYPVYFSSYEITDNRFEILAEAEKRSLMQGGNGQAYNERLYCNTAAYELSGKNKSDPCGQMEFNFMSYL